MACAPTATDARENHQQSPNSDPIGLTPITVAKTIVEDSYKATDTRSRNIPLTSLFESHRRRRLRNSSGFLATISDIEMRSPQRDELKSELFRCLLGHEYQDDPYSSTYYAFLNSQIGKFDANDEQGSRSFTSINNSSNSSEPPNFVDNVKRFTKDLVVQVTRLGNPRLTLEGILDAVLQERGCSLQSLEPEARKNAFQAPFAVIGWLSMLYEPSNTVKPGLFSIVTFKGDGNTVATRNVTSAKRPLTSLLSELGRELPPRSPDDASVALHAASLSFHALKTIGKVNVIWSNNLNTHLEFDISCRTLTLFRLPSFCAMYCMYGDQSGLLSWMLRGYFMPKTGSVKELMQEVLLSYRMLFGQSRQSRHLYSSHERSQAQSKDYPDLLLDLLCSESFGKAIRTLPSDFWPTACLDGYEQYATLLEQSVYNTQTDFPIYGMRLKALSDFSSRQRPSVLRDLWRDRRDPLQWYTFWAVFWIGGLSLILSVVQSALAAAQLQVAIQGLPATRPSA